MLSKLDDKQKRNDFVGNNIFASIQAAYGPEYAPKLTGMLLDENVINFTQLISDQGYISQKAYDAYSALNQSQNQTQQQ